MSKVCYPWISIRKSSAFPDSVGVFVKKHFSKEDLIGVFLGSKSDKHAAESRNKSLKDFMHCFANCPVDSMERNLGLSTQCINNRNYYSNQNNKDFHNCYFCE